MLLLLCLVVIGFAAYAVARTPAEERSQQGWPAPAPALTAVLALPAAVLVLYLVPWLGALALLGLTVAWWARARPPLPRAPSRRRPRA